MTGTAARPEVRRVDANSTMLRLRALHVMGHSCARIARAIGVREAMIQRIARGQAKTVTPALCNAVAQVYDRWWDKRAPEHTPAERTAAGRARRRARHGDWCPGAALDDDQLDHPGYQPLQGWLPARGTGTVGPPTATARKTEKSIA
jgi:transcriptional regulator with XRE-family HTH domain